jgi:hypothetical protein
MKQIVEYKGLLMYVFYSLLFVYFLLHSQLGGKDPAGQWSARDYGVRSLAGSLEVRVLGHCCSNPRAGKVEKSAVLHLSKAVNSHNCSLGTDAVDID